VFLILITAYLKVKDIRNKYKVRDYENYAKPKSATAGKAAQNDKVRCYLIIIIFLLMVENLK